MSSAGPELAEILPGRLSLASPDPGAGSVSGAAALREAEDEAPADAARLRALVAANYDFVWRSLRRLGVGSIDVDDCAQQVFWVASRRLSGIEVASERAFLFGTAIRVASDARRTRARRREVADDGALPERADSSPNPEDLADRRRARALLDEALEALPIDLRAVFVLFELEEMPTPEIAELLGLPLGTAASRLRRAREEFLRIAARLRARYSLGGAR